MSKNFTFHNFSPEMQVLIRASEAAFLPDKKAEVAHLVQNSTIDWDKVYQLSWNHQIKPILLRGVSGLPSELVPSPFMDCLKMACLKITTFALSQTKELQRLLALFKENNIRVVPYKGVTFASRYYGNLGLREFSDIDLFIYEKDILTLKKLFLGLGYVPQNNFTAAQEAAYFKISCEYNFTFYSADNKMLFHVEPHYRSNDLYDGIGFLTLEDCEDTLQKVDFNNITIQTLSVEDNFLIIMTHHGAKEAWSRLKYLIDIYAIIKKEQNTINWEVLLEKAAKLHATTSLLIGLGMIYELFDIALPPSVISRFKNPKIVALVENRYKNLNGDYGAYSTYRLALFKLKSIDGWANKLKNVFLKLTIPNSADLAFVNLPPHFFFLYIFIRPIRVIKKQYVKSS